MTNIPAGRMLGLFVGHQESQPFRYPLLGRDLLAVLLPALAGGGFATLFTWEGSNAAVSVSAGGIFLHNMLLALCALPLTGHGALVLMVLNGFWLGMGLAASINAVGLQQTLGLTAVHVPLEILAWVLTIHAARGFWPTIVCAIKKERGWRQTARKLGTLLAAPTAFYVLAALSEWAEYALLER